MKVMICDDAGFVREILRQHIGLEPGVQIFEAVNGKQAIEVASSVRPELVFLDIVLPVKSGIEVAKVLKAQDPQVKIISISTMGAEDLPQLGLADTFFDGHVTKPFSKDQILQFIRR